jgi:hypothetical protein
MENETTLKINEPVETPEEKETRLEQLACEILGCDEMEEEDDDTW